MSLGCRSSGKRLTSADPDGRARASRNVQVLGGTQPGAIGEAGPDVVLGERWILGEDLSDGHAVCEQTKDEADPDASASYRRPAEANVEIDRDPIKEVGPLHVITVALHADLESGWFGSWLVVHGRLHSWGWSLRGEVVLVDPCREWFGEGSVVTAGVVEVVGGVDECGRWCGVPGGPGVPVVESVESLLRGGEAVLIAVEAASELPVDLEVLIEPATVGAELVALVEERPGAAGEFVERGASGGDVVGGLGEGVAGGPTVEASGGGEFSFGVASALFVTVQICGGASDGVVVGGAAWFEVGELSAELDDALPELGVPGLFGGVGGVCVGELGAGGVVEVGEPVGDLTSRPRRD